MPYSFDEMSVNQYYTERPLVAGGDLKLSWAKALT